MATVEAPLANAMTVNHSHSFMDLVLDTPQPILKVVISFRTPKVEDGEVCVVFSKEEVENSAMLFKYSIVLKFLRQRPSLDAIIAFIRSRWGLNKQLVVSLMLKPRNVFIRMSNEKYFIEALTQGGD